MALPPEQERQFNYYAKLARIEFEKKWPDWDASDVARWWDKWVDSGKTNHDRLGRILIHCTGIETFRGKPNSRPYLFKELDNSTTL